MSAVGIPLKIECYGDFTLPFYIEDAAHNPIDLTGYTLRMSIRADLEAEDTLLDLTESNGYLPLTDPENGEFSIVIPHAITSGFPAGTTAVYDLYVINPANIRERYVEGTILFSGSATRDF